MIDDFQFQEGTSFDRHKGTPEAPRDARKKWKGHRQPNMRATSKGGNVREEPLPPEIGEKPLPAPYSPTPRKPGKPRSGRWPFPKPKTKTQKEHAWAESGLWRPHFITWLSRTGNITESALRANVHRMTVVRARHSDPVFDAECTDAMEQYIDQVECEVARRSIEGDEKFILDKKTGDLVSLGKAPSDLLLMFYAKKLRGAFRDNFKGDDSQQTVQVLSDIVVKFFQSGMGFNPDSDDQASAPDFEAFAKEATTLALPAPESVEDKRARLLRELAELDELKAAADAAVPPHADD